LFKGSPTVNGILQRYVEAEFGHEIQLKLDVHTRWNSILPMLKTFSRGSASIKKALVDVIHLELWRSGFLESIESLVNVLTAVKMATDGISVENASLLNYFLRN
jgi:hypothetical protein